MLKANENDFSYRFGDNGPKYLIQGPNIDLGLVVIQPGQEFQKSLPYNVKKFLCVRR